LREKVFYTVFCVSTLIEVGIVTDPTYAQFNPSDVDASIKFLLISETFYILTLLAFKISLCLFFLRITDKTWHRVVSLVAVTTSTVFSTAYFFFAVFQCGYPSDGVQFMMRKLANQCVPKGPSLGMGYTHALIVSLTDITFAVLPLTLLHETNLNFREKITVGMILILGTAYVSFLSFCVLERIPTEPIYLFGQIVAASVLSSDSNTSND